jgi:hypothetical protein
VGRVLVEKKEETGKFLQRWELIGELYIDSLGVVSLKLVRQPGPGIWPGLGVTCW